MQTVRQDATANTALNAELPGSAAARLRTAYPDGSIAARPRAGRHCVSMEAKIRPIDASDCEACR